MAILQLLLLGLCAHFGIATPINSESAPSGSSHNARNDLSPAAFWPQTPRPDLYSIPCFACLMEECPEVRRYAANETVWTKCDLTGTMAPEFGDSWFETVDGCYIMDSDFRYYPHWASKRSENADPICDVEKAHRLPNTTTPHSNPSTPSRRQTEPAPTYLPAIVDPKHDKKCLVCADPLCEPDAALLRNASIELECWTVSTMGPGDVISFPKYDERWVMTKEGCYLALSEVVTPTCADGDIKRCLPYCEPPPHYWAKIKNWELAKTCARNCSDATGWVRELYIADFDCWDYGDVVQGSDIWFKGSEFKYNNREYLAWWPKAALGEFGGTGQPPNQCEPGNGTDTDPDRRRSRSSKHIKRTLPRISIPNRSSEIKALDHPVPRGLQVVYALIRELDTRCRLCAKRICPYYTVYQPGENMDFNCFVYGTVVDGSDIWLKSGEAVRCYVPRAYVTLNGGSSISYCRGDGTDSRRSLDSTSTVQTPETNEASKTVEKRVPAPQVSDPSLDPNPPRHDYCQETPQYWEDMCYNQALACCVKRTPVDIYWQCTSDRYMASWRQACQDLRTQTNCTVAVRTGNLMEGCEGGDVYRDPGQVV